MNLLATPFTFFEISVFVTAIIALLLAVRFFIASQRRFEHLMPEKGKKRVHTGIGIDRDGFIVPTRRVQKPTASDPQNDEETKQEIRELRNMVQLQQLELTRALRQLESLNDAKPQKDYSEKYFDDEEDEEEEEPYRPSEDFRLVDELRRQLARKEAELKELHQQAELNQKLQTHFEEVQSGYEELQLKVHKMESQAWQSAELTIKVDNLQQQVEQLELTVHKKEEKIRELSVENGRLHDLLAQTEDKLSEANLQRQQLMKKVQFLEEMASDIQQMTDANRKLKTELRRVAELESMLNLITEERDALLNRKRF